MGTDSDLSLLGVAQGALKSANWQSEILVGRNMLHVGENSCNSQLLSEEKV